MYLKTAATTSLLAFISISVFISDADARRMGPAASGKALEVCMMSGDATYGDNSMYYGCCSREAGICVICPKPLSPTGNDSCNVVSYRASGLNGLQVIPESQFSGKYRK